MASHLPIPETPSRQPSKRLAPPSLSFGPSSQDAAVSSTPQTPAISSPPQTSTAASTRPSPSPAAHSSRNNQSQLNTPSAAATGAKNQRKPSATAETWNALQSTLEEVELNALSGASVFGAEHSRALEELRRAQIELARAWARSEADGDGDRLEDEAVSPAAGSGAGANTNAGDGKSGDAIVSPGTRSAVLARHAAGRTEGGSRMIGSGVKSTTKTNLEEETENDIKMARERRLANDRYFERVNKGVVDVVAKLEVVAQKMGGVELESQEIWGEDNDSDSLDSGRG